MKTLILSHKKLSQSYVEVECHFNLIGCISLMKLIIQKLLNLGVIDEFDNDLNQKQVMNFSYLMFCMICLFMLILFIAMQQTYIALFSSVCFLIGIVGLRYSYMGRTGKAQLFMPVTGSLFLVILSLFYFGEGSGFHWFFINIIVYTITVFKVDQYFIKPLMVISSIFLFCICEFLSLRGSYLSVEHQGAVAFLVFMIISFYLVVVANLILNKLKLVNYHLDLSSEIDALTGLANRKKMLTNIARVSSYSLSNRLQYVVAVVDLDHFKHINNTYGHEAGDLVLVQTSATICSIIGEQGEVGRYGSEEFIIVMQNTNLKQAEVVMENMRQSIENMFVETEQGIIIPVTISIGLASNTSNAARYDEILTQADKGLYTAKRNGRNRIFVQTELQN